MLEDLLAAQERYCWMDWRERRQPSRTHLQPSSLPLGEGASIPYRLHTYSSHILLNCGDWFRPTVRLRNIIFYSVHSLARISLEFNFYFHARISWVSQRQPRGGLWIRKEAVPQGSRE